MRRSSGVLEIPSGARVRCILHNICSAFCLLFNQILYMNNFTRKLSVTRGRCPDTIQETTAHRLTRAHRCERKTMGVTPSGQPAKNSTIHVPDAHQRRAADTIYDMQIFNIKCVYWSYIHQCSHTDMQIYELAANTTMQTNKRNGAFNHIHVHPSVCARRRIE